MAQIVMTEDEFAARSMGWMQWTWPIDITLGDWNGLVDTIWPVVEGWGDSFKNLIKSWFGTSSRTYSNSASLLSDLQTAADWAAAQCGIAWRTTWGT